MMMPDTDTQALGEALVNELKRFDNESSWLLLPQLHLLQLELLLL